MCQTVESASPTVACQFLAVNIWLLQEHVACITSLQGIIFIGKLCCQIDLCRGWSNQVHAYFYTNATFGCYIYFKLLVILQNFHIYCKLVYVLNMIKRLIYTLIQYVVKVDFYSGQEKKIVSYIFFQN